MRADRMRYLAGQLAVTERILLSQFPGRALGDSLTILNATHSLVLPVSDPSDGHSAACRSVIRAALSEYATGLREELRHEANAPELQVIRSGRPLVG